MTRITSEPYEVHHIVSLQGKTVCGLHCEDNLQVVTKTENLKIGNKFWPNNWE